MVLHQYCIAAWRISARAMVSPQEVMDQLRAAYHGNLARNMYLYAELRRILEALREKDVEVIFLKGAALAKTVYGDIGLRQMSDIDILAKKEDLPKAVELLFHMGYGYANIRRRRIKIFTLKN